MYVELLRRRRKQTQRMTKLKMEKTPSKVLPVHPKAKAQLVCLTSQPLKVKLVGKYTKTVDLRVT